MKNEKSCQHLTINHALTQLPGPAGERFAAIFEHGTLQVEIYAPHGSDSQNPHTRDEIYFAAAGHGEYVCGDKRQTFGPTDLLFATGVSTHDRKH